MGEPASAIHDATRRRRLLLALGLIGLTFLPLAAAVGLVAVGLARLGPPQPPPAGELGPPAALPPFSSVSAVAVSAGGQRLAAMGNYDHPDGSSRDSLRVWNAGIEGPTFAREFRLKSGGPMTASRARIGLSPDGTILAVVTWDFAQQKDVIAVWAVENPKPIVQIDRPTNKSQFLSALPGENMYFTADGTTAGFAFDGLLVTVRIADGKATVSRLGGTPILHSVYSPALGRVFALSHGEKGGTELFTWDAAGGPPAVISLESNWWGNTWFAVSANGRVIGELHNDVADGEVRVYDSANGRLLSDWRFPGGTGRTRELAISPNGRQVAVSPVEVGNGRWAVELWSALDGTLIHRDAGEKKPGVDYGRVLTFSGDGSTLVYVRQGREVVRFDTVTGLMASD